MHLRSYCNFTSDRGASRRLCELVHLLRKPKVGDLIDPVAYEYVLGFEVAVHYLFLVQCLNRKHLTAKPIISCARISIASC